MPVPLPAGYEPLCPHISVVSLPVPLTQVRFIVAPVAFVALRVFGSTGLVRNVTSSP